MQKNVAFLFDHSGIIVEPWLEAGYTCYSFDMQHDSDKEGQHFKIGMEVDPYRKLDAANFIYAVCSQADFVFGFPPCTDTAVSGSKHMESKREKDPLFQLKAAELADLVRCVGVLFGCPWGFENPRSVLSTQYRKYDFRFDPCDYGGYLPEDDQHPYHPEIYPPRDAYKKDTWIWCSPDMKIPKPKPVPVLDEDNPGWKKLGGKSLKTKNIRGMTPHGFARALFEANHK